MYIYIYIYKIDGIIRFGNQNELGKSSVYIKFCLMMQWNVFFLCFRAGLWELRFGTRNRNPKPQQATLWILIISIQQIIQKNIQLRIAPVRHSVLVRLMLTLVYSYCVDVVINYLFFFLILVLSFLFFPQST